MSRSHPHESKVNGKTLDLHCSHDTTPVCVVAFYIFVLYLLSTSIYRTTALHIGYYILFPEKKTFTNYYTLFPLHYKQLRPWEVCSLNDPWSFAVSHSLMHFMHRSSMYLKVIAVLHYNNHDGVIHACGLKACVSSKCRKCISAIKRVLTTTAMHIPSSSFMYLCISL